MVFPPVADSFAKHEILWSLFSLQHLCFIKALLICFNSVQWGIPAPLFLFFLLSFPFVLNSFSPHCLSLFLLLASAFSSPFLSSPRGSECFNNDALGIWDGRTVFFPSSLFILLPLSRFNPSLLKHVWEMSNPEWRKVGRDRRRFADDGFTRWLKSVFFPNPFVFFFLMVKTLFFHQYADQKQSPDCLEHHFRRLGCDVTVFFNDLWSSLI